MAKGYATLLGAGRQRPPAAGGGINFVRLHVNRASAGNSIIDIEYDGAVPDTSEAGITIEIQSSVGNDTTWTAISAAAYTTTTVASVYKRLTLTGTVKTILSDHNLRYSHDGAQSGLATEFNLTTMTNSSTLQYLGVIDYGYNMDGVSGGENDIIGTLNLTDNGTVQDGTGPNATSMPDARKFQTANVEYFSHTDNDTFSPGDFDHSWWIVEKFDTVGDEARIFGKAGSSDGEFRHRLSSGDKIRYEIAPAGSMNVYVNSTETAVTATWYGVYMYHDNGTEIGVSVNDGTAATQSHVTGMHEGTQDFKIAGAAAYNGDLDGEIACYYSFTRLLTAAEITDLYNGGNFKRYPFKPTT